ncbi:MAG: RNA chaperone Hfq [Ruminococcaceae bacterium]|nr:RNA chaperone Hfq [Oscillospiraceae bacterium]
MDNTINTNNNVNDEVLFQDNLKTKNINLQDLFLNTARKEKTVITIFLMNGFQLKGIVKGFDTYVVLFESEGKINMVYKHAISTIQPSKPIDIFS